LNYRTFGSLGWKSSILGFGVKKLPSIDLIRYAIDQGINYVNPGYPFDPGRHESIARAVGAALDGGRREKIKVAVTVPSHLINSARDLESFLQLQLGWLKIDHADFCLLGRLNRDNWPVLKRLGALDWLESAKCAGLVENAGFSFHDHYQILRSILQSYDRWTLAQFQFSYMDVDHDPGLTGVKYAASRGLAVVVSEPLRDGRLSRLPPEPAARVWAETRQPCSLTEWGLRFIWNYPEISTAVCNVNSLDEISECLASADRAAADQLSVPDEILISRMREARLKLKPLSCPSCRGCMPCPEGIDVPRIFEIYNDAFIYDDVAAAQSIYAEEHHKADRCTECGECDTRCARRLRVVDWLRKARALLSG
jgi:predicted aldo/keto reductase-like oxidoreductase